MEILNQFGINSFLLFAQVVNFLVLLFILKKFLYGPILRVLESRKKTIEQSLKNADEIEQRLIKLAEEEENRIVAASKEAEKIVQEASSQGVQIVEEAKRKAEEILAETSVQAKEMMRQEKESLVAEIKENVGSLFTVFVQKVVGKALTGKDQKELIERSVKDLRSNL